MNARNQDMLLGLVFFSALLGLGIVTIVLSDFSLGVDWHRVDFFSEDVGYLRPGDPVLLFGMASGKIETIERLDVPVEVDRPLELDGSSLGRVRCTVKVVARLDLDPREHLRRDYRVLIEDRGLLGGKLVRMELGTGDSLPRDTVLLAEAPPSVLQSASQILEENRAAVQATIQDLSDIAEKASNGQGTLGLLLADAATEEKVRGMIDDFATVGDRLSSGQGTLGKLLDDPAPFDDVKAAAADLRGITDRMSRGEGSAAKFLQNDEFYDSVMVVVNDAREGLKPVWDGEGTLGKLITTDELHASVMELSDELNEMARKANEGDGTIARLLNDDALYQNFNDLVADASKVFADVREGDGLVAALINDEQLLDDFRSILSQVLGAIEDARETTPVTSLGSFLFGTF